MHIVCPKPAYRPALQAAHGVVAVASRSAVPGLQFSHTVAARCGTNVPAAQFSHSVAGFKSVSALPGTHGEHSTDARAAKCPALQNSQPDDELLSISALPGGHAVQFAADFAEKNPDGHLMHSIDSLRDVNVPFGHHTQGVDGSISTSA